MPRLSKAVLRKIRIRIWEIWRISYMDTYTDTQNSGPDTYGIFRVFFLIFLDHRLWSISKCEIKILIITMDRIWISNFDFEFWFRVLISSFDFEFWFRVLISSFDFEFWFRVLISSFYFEFLFRVLICYKNCYKKNFKKVFFSQILQKNRKM